MKKTTYILGINFVYHELATCLLKDGELIAAVEEEKFNRIKHGKKALINNPDVLPVASINYCLNLACIKLKDVDYIGLSFYPKNRLKNIGIDPYFHKNDWGSKTGEELLFEKVNTVPTLLNEIASSDLSEKIKWIPHHLCHAASAYLVSPYSDAAILSIDGIGEIASTWMGKGISNKIEVIKEINYPNSIGFLWEKLCKFIGFSEYDAAKIMGLAAYGDWREFYPKFKEIIKLKNNGEYYINNKILKFRLDDFRSIEKIFGVNKIDNPNQRTQAHEDIAAALQRITNDIILHLAKYLAKQTESKNLCLSGGVALNCVTNAELMKSGYFKNIYIQPAAHDAGTALGAAYYIWNNILGNKKKMVMNHAYWGPKFSEQEIEEVLRKNQVKYQKIDDIETRTAKLIADGKIVGWFQGRMEWGPRALGNRSLLVDPRRFETKNILNVRIKRREPFRPFAPSILSEDVNKWFHPYKKCQSIVSEFMIINFDTIKEKQSLIPAVIHIDGTSRIQSVNKKINPKYHKLISEFKKITGVPIILNTSFNENEPIVCSPQDAVNTFKRTQIDYLAIGDFLVKK